MCHLPRLPVTRRLVLRSGSLRIVLSAVCAPSVSILPPVARGDKRAHTPMNGPAKRRTRAARTYGDWGLSRVESTVVRVPFEHD